MIDSTLRDQMAAAWPDLVRFGYQLCHDRGRAEDLAQDTCERILRAAARDNDLVVESFPGYARTTIIRLHLRSLQRRGVLVLGLGDDARDSPVGSDAPAILDRDEVWQLLGQPSERHRTVLVLRFYADWTDSDIADELGCAMATVRSLVHRAICAVRARSSDRLAGDVGNRVTPGER